MQELALSIEGGQGDQLAFMAELQQLKYAISSKLQHHCNDIMPHSLHLLPFQHVFGFPLQSSTIDNCMGTSFQQSIAQEDDAVSASLDRGANVPNPFEIFYLNTNFGQLRDPAESAKNIHQDYSSSKPVKVRRCRRRGGRKGTSNSTSDKSSSVCLDDELSGTPAILYLSHMAVIQDSMAVPSHFVVLPELQTYSIASSDQVYHVQIQHAGLYQPPLPGRSVK